MYLITESQHDNNWLNERKKLITATDISSVLDSNPFKSKRALCISLFLVIQLAELYRRKNEL